MWKYCIKEMEEYLEAYLKWKRGTDLHEKHRELLGFLLRPTLAEILRVLAVEEENVNKEIY